MITETMPLNEWPLIDLKILRQDLLCSVSHYEKNNVKHKSTLEYILAIDKAIKDVEFEQSKS